FHRSEPGDDVSMLCLGPVAPGRWPEALRCRRMMHLRITGMTWLAFGLLGAFASLFDLARNIALGAFTSSTESDIIAAVFCIAAVLAGYGLFRHRPWARVVCGVLGVVLFLYAMSYLLMVG